MGNDKTAIEIWRVQNRRGELYERLFERAKRRIQTNRELALKGVRNPTERANIELIYDQEESDARDDVKRWADMVVRAQEHAQVDDKSGLYREAAFAEWFGHSVSRLKDDEIAILIAFDLDGFKVINATIGHVAADDLLRRVGEAIQSTIRADDAGCRIGGDEFMILLSHMPEGTDTAAIISRLCSHLATVTWGKDKKPLSVSMGAVVVRASDAPFFSEARIAADQGCNVSKSLGRKRVTIINGDQYGTYRLLNGQVGEYQLVCFLDGSGLVADLEVTPEQCYHEVMTGLQRVIEEITTALGDRLIDKLYGTYAVRSLEELPIKKLADLLYQCRRKRT